METFILIPLSLLLVGAKTDRPNILIFMADDLGYGDLGAFGNSTIRTPFIDQLARQGMKFTHFLTPSPMCTPSRAAFMTGRYPVRLGMTGYYNGLSSTARAFSRLPSTGGLPTNETTFSEVAKRSGYRTGYIGKWHLGGYCNDFRDFCRHPLRRGFDYFYGNLLTLFKDYGDHVDSYMFSKSPNIRYQTCVTSLAAVLVPAVLWLYGLAGRRIISIILIIIFLDLIVSLAIPYYGVKFMNSVLHRNYEVVEMPIRFENLTQRLVWESVEFLEKASKRKDTPFLLFVSWFQVHTVLYNSVPGFRGRSAHGEYGDNVEEMDWSVGQVLNALDRLGLAKDTLVLFTSDNGGHVEETNHLGDRAGGHNGPWRGGKSHGGFDGGYRVPTVIRWPGVVPPGSSTDEPASFVDVFPTLTTLMGLPPSPKVHLDGVSLLPLLRGTKQSLPLGERFLFQFCADKVFAVRWRRSDAVWKLRLASPPWHPNSEQCSYLCSCFEQDGAKIHSEPFLYNLNRDPEERHAVDMKVGAHLEIRERMLNATRDHKRSIGNVPTQFSTAKVTYRPWLQPCCNFPFCNCKDTKWLKK